MLNKKKVILMTKLAMYEKAEAKNLSMAKKYFRGDYISWHIIKTVFAITLVFALCAGMWVIYNLELLMQNLAALNYMAIVRYTLILYVVFLVAYIAIAYVMYSVKFHRASKCLENYEKGLKQLAKACVEEGSDVQELEESEKSEDL